MAAANVRIIRCPKCESLLPEPPSFSTYQCGACGAVLQAKEGIPEGGLSKISGGVTGKRISGIGGISNASEVHMETSEGIVRSRVERIHNERVASSGSFESYIESDSDVSRRGEERIRGVERYDDEYSKYSQGLSRERNHGTKYGFDDTRPPMESSRPRPVKDQWSGQSNGRFDDFVHHGEGPSSYGMNPYYEHGERSRYPSHDLNGLAGVENMDSGRAELLRKIDELKDQLSRSCDMRETPKERIVPPIPPNPYSGHHHASYVQEGPYGGVNKQQLAPHDFRQTPGISPYTDRYGSGLRDPYSQGGYGHEYPEYANTYHQPEIHRRAPHQPQSQYMHRPYDGHFPRNYGNDNYDPFMLHPHENSFHQPTCSCVQCYNQNWNLPPNSDYHNHPSPLQQGHTSRGPKSHNSRESLPLNPSDLDSENDDFSNHHPRKAEVARRNKRVRHPIAGGAPFVACSKCFESLKLSRKHISFVRKQQKMKCGACSSIVVFELDKIGFSASVSAKVEQIPTEINEVPCGTEDENVRYCHNVTNSAERNNCFNDCDEAKSQPKISSIENKSDSSEPEKHLDHCSSTSSLSEDDEIPEKLTTPIIHDSPSAELSLPKDEPTHPGLSSQEHNDHCSDNIVVNRLDNGGETKRSELDTSRQDPLKDVTDASEMDVSSNAFSNSCVSQDSVERTKEDHPSADKGRVFAAFIKNGCRDFVQSQVSVNGHLIPDHDVKKAEKLAGPIQPGDYWYDIQAGFWGVMGHPCLGIIMPHIEEFNYPIPGNCASGNTGVFVNGRELHKKDLDLLVSRGLPNTRNGSYHIDISGKVVDKHTGEELDDLGKLAPTVQREKHGFGMKVPRFLR